MGTVSATESKLATPPTSVARAIPGLRHAVCPPGQKTLQSARYAYAIHEKDRRSISSPNFLKGLAAGILPTRNVLIVGTGEGALEIARSLSTSPLPTRVVRGFIGPSKNFTAPVLGNVSDLSRVARAEFVDEIIIASGNDRRLASAAVQEALKNNLDVSIVPDLLEQRPRKLTIKSIGALPLISIHEEPIPHFGLLIKRVFDIVLSLLAILICSPLMLAAALLIRLDSPGPALYSAPRAGKKGKQFLCYKFRTMHADAELRKEELRVRNERCGATFKIAADPRITHLGGLLRRYSIDELPQLMNVLKGDMSLVGPRPHPLDDRSRYQLEDLRRLDVAPGITGLWQVSARRDPSFHTNMALDLEYIENWSLAMDLRILLKTIPAVLKGTGV